MNFDEFFRSKKFHIITWGLAGLIVLLFVFGFGIFVGYKKASFSYRWGKNYYRNFAGPRTGFFRDFDRDLEGTDFINSNGIFGLIIKIDLPGQTLIVKGSDNVEKTVLVSDKTTIIDRRESIRSSDLKTDERVVIIGVPNEQGQIEAKFIRVFN